MLQKAEVARQAGGHKASKGSVPPPSQQSYGPVSEQGVGSSGRVQGRSTQLLQPLAVFGLLQKKKKKKRSNQQAQYNNNNNSNNKGISCGEVYLPSEL